jgi:hypothetical protein
MLTSERNIKLNSPCMTARTDTPEKPDQVPAPDELARLYLDLWEENLCLYAREGEPLQPGGGSKPDRPR